MYSRNRISARRFGKKILCTYLGTIPYKSCTRGLQTMYAYAVCALIRFQLYQLLNSLFQANTNCPRPENYNTDLSNGLNGTNPPTFTWSSIASACESGWDFSSRWFAHSGAKAGKRKLSVKLLKRNPNSNNKLALFSQFFNQ